MTGLEGRIESRVTPPAPCGPVPSSRQLRWHPHEFYGFLHFTVNTFTGKEWGYGNESPEVFHPTAFNAELIVKAAADGEMAGLILTCKHLDAPILWPGEDGAWDALCCDDPNVIFRDGQWWLYYKGRKRNSHPMNSFTGLATAPTITGPYTKHPENPLMSRHAGSAWVHRDGAHGVRWSQDGVHFVEAGLLPNKSTGLYCPENFGDGGGTTAA